MKEMTWQEECGIKFCELDWEQERYKCPKCKSYNACTKRTRFESTKNIFVERRCMGCDAVVYGAEFPTGEGSTARHDFSFVGTASPPNRK
jgi:hypothetical protein